MHALAQSTCRTQLFSEEHVWQVVQACCVFPAVCLGGPPATSHHRLFCTEWYSVPHWQRVLSEQALPSSSGLPQLPMCCVVFVFASRTLLFACTCNLSCNTSLPGMPLINMEHTVQLHTTTCCIVSKPCAQHHTNPVILTLEFPHTLHLQLAVSCTL